jgi:hypothetical protein
MQHQSLPLSQANSSTSDSRNLSLRSILMLSSNNLIFQVDVFNRFLLQYSMAVSCFPILSRLGGIVVSVLAAGLKGRRLKPGQGDGFLSVIKIHSTPSFGWEVKPEVSCRKILWHVKDLLKSHGDRQTKF